MTLYFFDFLPFLELPADAVVVVDAGFAGCALRIAPCTPDKYLSDLRM